MWKQRAVSLCSCIALLPLIVACTGGPGSPPQAYAPPAPSSPPSFAAIQTGLTPRYAAPAAEAAALPYQAAGVPAGPGGVYTVAARTSPGAIIVMLPGAGAVFPTDPALWAAQGFDVVAPPPAELYRLAAVQESATAHLIAEAEALADAPVWLIGPNSAIQAAMAALPPAGSGQVSGVVVTSAATGAGTCNEEMTYSYDGSGPPKLSVRKSGDACGPGSPFAIAPNSTVAPPGPAIPQHRPRLIETSVPAAPGHAPRVIEADAGGQLATPAQQQATVRQIADLIKSAPPG